MRTENKILAAVAGLILVFLVAFAVERVRPHYKRIVFSEFVAWVGSGQVTKVTIAGNEVLATVKGGETFETYMPQQAGDLVPSLLEHGVMVDVKPASSAWAPAVFITAPLLLIVCLVPLTTLWLLIVVLRRIRIIEEKVDLLATGRGSSRS